MDEQQEAPYILMLETATLVSSVALYKGEQMIAHHEMHIARTHARMLTPMIRAVLKHAEVAPAQLAAVAVSKGPGSYTGLRVGVSTAKGLCLALNKPLLAIDSMTALAWQVQAVAAHMHALICPMTDARRMEVYRAVFDAEVNMQTSIEAAVIEEPFEPDWMQDRSVLFVGDGVKKCLPILHSHPNAHPLPDQLPSARNLGKPLLALFQAAQFEDLTSFEPYYLKDFVATKPKNPLRNIK